MKRMFIFAFLIIVFSLFLSVRTYREMNTGGKIEKAYSGTLPDMMNPDIAVVYEKYSNPGLEYKKMDYEGLKIVTGRK